MEHMSAPTSEMQAFPEPQRGEAETKPATDPAGNETESSKEISTTENKPTYTDMASNAVGQAGVAAAGVKDSVFSMFGGGGAKEKRVEQEDDAAKDEPSGSSKAAKDQDADGEVCLFPRRCQALEAVQPTSLWLRLHG